MIYSDGSHQYGYVTHFLRSKPFVDINYLDLGGQRNQLLPDLLYGKSRPTECIHYR